MIPEGIGLELPTKNTEAPGPPHLNICPPSLQDKDFLATEDRIELRPVPYSAPAALPACSQHNSTPLIYLTLGTTFGTPELPTTAIERLATLDARVMVAAGRVHLEQLGDLPDNVTVQTWVPQAELLPHVDVVVHHGGSGSTLGALTVGAPQLILPQGPTSSPTPMPSAPRRWTTAGSGRRWTGCPRTTCASSRPNWGSGWSPSSSWGPPGWCWT
jgi:hypothetical protein